MPNMDLVVGKFYFSLYFQVTAHHEGNPGTEFKVGTRKRKLKQWPWRNATNWLAFQFVCLFNYKYQSFLASDGTTHSGLNAPTPIINQENSSHPHPWANLMETFLHLGLFLPKWLWFVPRWQKLDRKRCQFSLHRFSLFIDILKRSL